MELTKVLRCPHCKGILSFEVSRIKYYHISGDGTHLSRGLNVNRVDEFAESLICKKCGSDIAWKRDGTGRISVSEGV